MEKREDLCQVGENANWCRHYEKVIEVPQEIKNGTDMWSSNSTSEHITEWREITLLMRDLHPMLTAGLFTIAKTQKLSMYPLTQEWIKMWYTHNRILFSHKRMKFYHLQQHEWNLRTLCLVKQVRNKKTRMISLMWNLKKKRTWGFSGGSMVKNLPANAGDTGSVLDLGRSHMPRSNWTCAPQLLSLCSRVQEPQLLSPRVLEPML